MGNYKELLECDLILKGGVTSGLVFPGAIGKIARKYRFCSIGGTSAGAIGAVVAASAEYCRQSSESGLDFSGFDKTLALPVELGNQLESLFQPTPKLKPLFTLLLSQVSAQNQNNRFMAFVRAALAGHVWSTLISIATVLVLLFLSWQYDSYGLLAFTLLLLVVLPTVLIGFQLWLAVTKYLPENNFGLCSGIKTKDTANDALTDWIAKKIEAISGREENVHARTPPLTIGDLRLKGINIASMTTDLSSRRPYQLPFQTDIHYFRLSEITDLLPEFVCNYLIEVSEKYDTQGSEGELSDLYRLPVGDKMPLILVARMSLSFPGLIQAFPLYRMDDTAEKGSRMGLRMQRCLFSDGGISSNFPIHIFDSLIPSRPTFGISLSSLDRNRYVDPDIEPRATLSEHSTDSDQLPVYPISGITGFLAAILNTAKDWQDTLQSVLPGYAERIAVVRLDAKQEGGLNLTMDADMIQSLSAYGSKAGGLFVDTFSFSEHRYRRAISTFPVLAGSLTEFADTYNDPVGKDSDGFSFDQVLREYRPKYYQNSEEWRESPLNLFAKDLGNIGEMYRDGEQSELRFSSGNIPHVDSDLRIVASANRVPRGQTGEG